MEMGWEIILLLREGSCKSLIMGRDRILTEKISQFGIIMQSTQEYPVFSLSLFVPPHLYNTLVYDLFQGLDDVLYCFALETFYIFL